MFFGGGGDVKYHHLSESRLPVVWSHPERLRLVTRGTFLRSIAIILLPSRLRCTTLRGISAMLPVTSFVWLRSRDASLGGRFTTDPATFAHRASVKLRVRVRGEG